MKLTGPFLGSKKHAEVSKEISEFLLNHVKRQEISLPFLPAHWS